VAKKKKRAKRGDEMSSIRLLLTGRARKGERDTLADRRKR